MKRGITLVGLLLLFGACEKRRTSSNGDMPSSQVNSKSAQKHAEGGLIGELQHQAQNRPIGTPRVEDVLSALAKAGITVTRSQQVLASPLHARYCVAASTGDGLGLSICEFDDAARAQAGRALSQKAMVGRAFALRDKTLLTVIGPATDAARLIRVFEQLSAR